MILKSEKVVSTPWFASWFDTSYYHTLYKHRNDDEAHFFMDNLINLLNPSKDSAILDLACGRGRHSVYLFNKGFEVIGIDLSKESISFAQQFEEQRLKFFTHDMRAPFNGRKFDYIFNLFTSFGFFDNNADHQKTLNNISEALQPNGTFVIDFLNVEYVRKGLIPLEQKVIDGITFNIKRFIKDGFIIKQISFQADGSDWSFEERVRGFSKDELLNMITKSGLGIENTFGNYQLEAFDEMNSERMIIVAKK
jgi:SAM-dependent methyltransferase